MEKVWYAYLVNDSDFLSKVLWLFQMLLEP
jgi:hypothetical protein